MMYSLSVSVSNLHAMYQPIASIPLSGTVPTKVTGILLCTGCCPAENWAYQPRLHESILALECARNGNKLITPLR